MKVQQIHDCHRLLEALGRITFTTFPLLNIVGFKISGVEVAKSFQLLRYDLG